MKRTKFSQMAQDFLDGKIDAENFYNRFMDEWIANHNSKEVQPPYIEQSLSLAVDSYCPLAFRDSMNPDIDYDEVQLKQVVGIYMQTDDVDEAYRLMKQQNLI